MSIKDEIEKGENKKLEFKSATEGVYIRIASTTRKADQNTIQDLERERRNIGFDEEISYNYTRNLESEIGLKYDFLEYTGKVLSENDLINLKLLKSKDGELLPTNGYILLTDRNQYFDYAAIKCARFKGNDTTIFIDRKEIDGPCMSR